MSNDHSLSENHSTESKSQFGHPTQIIVTVHEDLSSDIKAGDYVLDLVCEGETCCSYEIETDGCRFELEIEHQADLK